jgi:hypothetical protein
MLDKAKLKAALKAIQTDVNLPADDEDSVWFEREMTAQEAANLWADAMEAYATDVVQGGTGAAPGRGPLAAALKTAFEAHAPAPTALAAAMELAFTAFATAVGTGMASSTPISFTATPPVGPVGFAALFGAPPHAAVPPQSSEESATALSNAIDTWMNTGAAIPNTPPGAGSVPWS